MKRMYIVYQIYVRSLFLAFAFPLTNPLALQITLLKFDAFFFIGVRRLPLVLRLSLIPDPLAVQHPVLGSRLGNPYSGEGHHNRCAADYHGLLGSARPLSISPCGTSTKSSPFPARRT